MSVEWTTILLAAGITTAVVGFGSRASAATRKLLVYSEFGFIAIYQYWRIFRSLPELVTFGAWLGLLLLGIELILLQTRVRRRMNLLAVPSDRTAAARSARGTWSEAWVDIFIPSYNEPVRVLEKTLHMAKRVDHPRKRVWLLDDGRRSSMKELATRLDVHYLARSTNEHAKAGNLQNAYEAVQRSGLTSDFVLVLDADFQVHPDFLKKTLPLFEDASIGCVQTPQSFFNPDPFQYAFKAQDFWPDDQRPWFEYELPSLDAKGGALCCGTSFVLRQTALREIGGFPTEAISEDMLTTMKLAARKFKTIYLNERLSMGLAPEGVKEFLVQRGRWCLGSLQVLLGRWGPTANKRGLQKILTTVGCFGWSLWTLYQLLWILATILYWWFDVRVVRVETGDVMLFVVPLLIVRVGFSWLSGWCWIPFVQSASQLLAAPAVLQGALRGIFARDSKKFSVTAKGTSRDRVTYQVPWIYWYAGASLLLLLGTARGVTNGEFGWMGVFSVGQLTVLLAATYACIEAPKFRRDERILCPEGAVVYFEGRSLPVQLLDISEGGAGLTGCDLPVGSVIALEVDGAGTLSGTVVRTDEGLTGVAFHTDEELSAALVAKVYALRDQYLARRRWSSPASLAALMRRICA